MRSGKAKASKAVMEMIMTTLKTIGLIALVPLSLTPIGLGAFSSAAAQSAHTTLTPYQRGYGLARNQLQVGVDPSTRDANGNRVLLDGALMTGADNSVYTQSQTFGVGDVYSGAGGIGGVTAIGNNLQVIVNGNYNVVTVNAHQINNGNVTATNNNDTLNGQVNLHGN
jgi:holdfast attachment protein HfaA